MNKFFVLLASILIISCAKNSTVTSYQSEGNLEAPDLASCVGIEQLKPEQNPADIFLGMKQCLNSENYSLAAEMYFGAMTYAVYDAERVSDRTSHQAITILRMNTFNSLSEQQLLLLQTEIDSIKANSTKTYEALAARGQPNYYPKYMIQHGMGASLGDQSDNEIVKNFDSSAAWIKAASRLRCS